MKEPATSSRPNATPHARLTKSEYEQRYKAIRERYIDQVGVLEQPFKTAIQERNPVRFAQVIGEFVPAMRFEADGLAALRPPRDIADEHDRYAALLNEIADAYERHAQDVIEASTAEAAGVEYVQLLRLTLKREPDRRARAFARAAEQGGYDLRTGPRETPAPG